MDRCGGGRCDVEIRSAIHVLHEGRFPSPVIFIVLDDTKRIDPEILDSEFAVDLYGVGKSSGQLFWRDALGKRRDVIL
jgi:hypothetical protein